MNRILAKYWKAYGGFSALFASPYLRSAVVLTLILFPLWTKPDWWSDVLSIMPSLLGFSLGGYAMWMAIGDDNFRQLISGEDEDGETSPYMTVNAAFVHFILLQMLSILLALIAKAYYFELPPSHWFANYLWLSLFYYFFCYLVFIYALLSAVAATLALLDVSSWYDLQQTAKKKEKDETSEGQ